MTVESGEQSATYQILMQRQGSSRDVLGLEYLELPSFEMVYCTLKRKK